MPGEPVGLDAHQKPPELMRALFKKYQKASRVEIIDDLSVIDLESRARIAQGGLKVAYFIHPEQRLRAFQHLANQSTLNLDEKHRLVSQGSAAVYEVQALPGLFIIPSLISQALQLELLNRLLHRDLANPHHGTNLHLHYLMFHESSSAYSSDVSGSWFSANPQATFQPRDSDVHKEMSLQRMLEKKLRWMTLGGQYNWTAKKYPHENPPPFPTDVGGVLKTLFPDVDPQAAILNFYSPGDTLSVHRDVSEECDRGLISISFGCEAVFVVGDEHGSKTATIRLRSGDALLMTGSSRFAWHGIPRVFAGTCPDWLQDWPLLGDYGAAEMEKWKGWMAGKRLNLNVRQMRVSDVHLGGLDLLDRGLGAVFE